MNDSNDLVAASTEGTDVFSDDAVQENVYVEDDYSTSTDQSLDMDPSLTGESSDTSDLFTTDINGQITGTESTNSNSITAMLTDPMIAGPLLFVILIFFILIIRKVSSKQDAKPVSMKQRDKKKEKKTATEKRKKTKEVEKVKRGINRRPNGLPGKSNEPSEIDDDALTVLTANTDDFTQTNLDFDNDEEVETPFKALARKNKKNASLNEELLGIGFGSKIKGSGGGKIRNDGIDDEIPDDIFSELNIEETEEDTEVHSILDTLEKSELEGNIEDYQQGVALEPEIIPDNTEVTGNLSDLKDSITGNAKGISSSSLSADSNLLVEDTETINNTTAGQYGTGFNNAKENQQSNDVLEGQNTEFANDTIADTDLADLSTTQNNQIPVEEKYDNSEYNEPEQIIEPEQPKCDFVKSTSMVIPEGYSTLHARDSWDSFKEISGIVGDIAEIRVNGSIVSNCFYFNKNDEIELILTNSFTAPFSINFTTEIFNCPEIDVTTESMLVKDTVKDISVKFRASKSAKCDGISISITPGTISKKNRNIDYHISIYIH